MLKLAGELAAAEAEGERLVAGGGAPLAVCLHRARAAGLGGIEFACAIPGTAGGGVWMNAGAYGGDIAGVLERALVVDRGRRRLADAGRARARVPALGALRHGQVVARAELRARAAAGRRDQGGRWREMQARRKAAQPTNKRTFGSVFKNPEHELSRRPDARGVRPARHRIGGAQISPRHANFIENAGDATSADAIALMAEARRRAREQFGVDARARGRVPRRARAAADR